MPGGSGMQHSQGGELSPSFAERVERKRVAKLGTLEVAPEVMEDKIALGPYRDAIIRALLGCQDMPGYQAAFGDAPPRVQLVAARGALYEDIGYLYKGFKQYANDKNTAFLQVTAGQSGVSRHQLLLNVDPATTVSATTFLTPQGPKSEESPPGFACTLKQLLQTKESVLRNEYECSGIEIFPAASPMQLAERIANAIADVTLACTPAQEPASTFHR